MIPLCAPNIPLYAHIVYKEALVAVLRRLHIRSKCPLFGVVLESDFFPFPGMRAYWEKRHAEYALLEGKSVHLSIYD